VLGDKADFKPPEEKNKL